MADLKRFFTVGSPLQGRAIPRDWFAMDANGKRKALVDYGYARNWGAACSMLGRHAAAIRSAKAAKKRARRYLNDRKDLD